MKIALTGPSGSGKTTIAQIIKNLTGFKYMSMSAGDILSLEQKEYLRENYGYDNLGHRNVIQLSNKEPNFGKMFQKMVAKQRYDLIHINDNFIIDRCPIDNLTYFLLQASQYCSVKEVEEFIDICKLGMIELDIIIFCHSKAEEIENNGSRVDNKYYQRMTEKVFSYSADLLMNKPIYHLDTWDLEEKEMLIKSTLVNEGVAINNK